MSLRGRLDKLRREAADGAAVIRLRDGTARYFDDNTAFGEMFLAKMGLFRGDAPESEVLDAVRNATPESRRAFEDEYGPLEMEVAVVASPAEGGWVEVTSLSESGEVEKVRHDEGGSPEAERLRAEARQNAAGGSFL